MIADKYDTVFMDGKLTHLMIIKKGERNYIPKKLDYPLYCLLKAFLNNYGISMIGATHIGDYEVRGVCIGSDFKITNELVLRELYAFTSGRVNISLWTDLNKDCAFAFWYDLTNYQCELVKYEHGETKESIEFDNLKALLHYLKKREAAAK